MPKHTYGNPEPFRGHTLYPRFTDGKLTLCDVYKPNELEHDEERVATFRGPDARSKAKRWILTEEAKEKYPRITMRRVSNSR